MTTNDQTAAVFKHHVDSVMALDFPAVLSDYTDDSVFKTPAGTVQGVAAVGEAMAGMADILTPEKLAKFEVSAQDINGEYVYLAWSIPGVVAFGNDTFRIQNGKIVLHTVGYHAAS